MAVDLAVAEKAGAHDTTISDEYVEEAHMPDDGEEDDHDRLLEGKKLLRKIDLMVLPWLCLLYALSFIDRSNISAAKIAGMEKDLVLTGARYSTVLLAFFPTYIATEIPSNSIIRRVGTKRYLTFLIVSWGAVAMCCGFVKNWHQLAALRVLLGTFEGGFTPACFYLISTWYKRYEVQKRIAIWYTFGTLMSGFNGIISYGLSTMEGVGGLRGWRWIFIVPGAVTILFAIPIFLFVTDFPERSSWLKPRELALVRIRLLEDRHEHLEVKLTLKGVLKVLLDVRIWLMAFLLGLVTTGTYVMAFFTPSILKSFGYSTALSQVLVTPPYILAVIVTISIGAWSDRIQRRTPFMYAFFVLTTVGFAMIGWGNNTGSRLFGIFLAITSVNAVTPCLLAFMVNNVPNPSRRQIAVPLQSSFAGVGGIIGSTIFRQRDYPGYRPGLYGAFTAMGLAILITAGLSVYFRSRNRKADTEGEILEGIEGFRYTL